MKPTITMSEIEKLRATGHVVAIYPKKKIAVVDGFKYFRLVK